MTSESYKADLAEYSLKVYDKFLHVVFKDSSSNVPDRHLILLYCFLHKVISYSQLTLLFGSTIAKKKAITMVVKRLRDNDYLINLKSSKYQTSNIGDSQENTYGITAAGVKYCSQLVRELFPIYMPVENLSTSNYSYSLDEVIKYLSNRCLDGSPTYINHYLAIRDINAYLLSSPFSSMEYSYDTEVEISEEGVPVSIYTRSLLGLNKKASPLRCDALMRYPLENVSEALTIYIELDTGSQRSSLLTEKVNNYIIYCLDTAANSPLLSSLLFCLHTKADSSDNKLSEIKGSYGTKDYYYLFTVEVVADILKLVNGNSQLEYTAGDVLNYLNGARHLSPSLSQLFNYLTKTDGLDLSVPISELKQNYYAKRDKATEKRTEIIAHIHRRKYHNRRSLLHRAVSSIPKLHEYILRGFSLYTAPNYDLDGTFPYLLPEMFQYRNKLKRLCLSLGLVGAKSIPSYSPIYDLGPLVVRNLYSFNEDGLKIIVENVSDDLGGLTRLCYLLNLDTLPECLSDTKILCLLDSTCIDDIKTLYLSSRQGKLLSLKAGSRCERNVFEIFFATYEAIRFSGSIFTFDSNGDVVYKNN